MPTAVQGLINHSFCHDANWWPPCFIENSRKTKVWRFDPHLEGQFLQFYLLGKVAGACDFRFRSLRLLVRIRKQGTLFFIVQWILFAIRNGPFEVLWQDKGTNECVDTMLTYLEIGWVTNRNGPRTYDAQNPSYHSDVAVRASNRLDYFAHSPPVSLEYLIGFFCFEGNLGA